MLQTNLQHGEFDIKISGQVLVASLAGSWNEEAARAFDREFRLAAEPLLGAPWAHLVYLDDWSLGVPEMKPVIEQLVAWCCAHGLKRAAKVYSPSMLKTPSTTMSFRRTPPSFRRPRSRASISLCGKT